MNERIQQLTNANHDAVSRIQRADQALSAARLCSILGQSAGADACTAEAAALMRAAGAILSRAAAASPTEPVPEAKPA